MAHKNLIDGTAYDTNGGRCLVDGTGYDVKKGRTLVDGTGYDVGFSVEIPVTITLSYNESKRYISVNGTKYNTKGTHNDVVSPGDSITFRIGDLTVNDTLYINGTLTKTASANTAVSYTWTVPDGISSISISMGLKSTSVTTS